MAFHAATVGENTVLRRKGGKYPPLQWVIGMISEKQHTILGELKDAEQI